VVDNACEYHAGLLDVENYDSYGEMVDKKCCAGFQYAGFDHLSRVFQRASLSSVPALYFVSYSAQADCFPGSVQL
jgi:hypothetical protein